MYSSLVHIRWLSYLLSLSLYLALPTSSTAEDLFGRLFAGALLNHSKSGHVGHVSGVPLVVPNMVGHRWKTWWPRPNINL